MSAYRHCEFGHLMTLVRPPHPFPAYFGHVHEDEALPCAWFERMGWPDSGEVLS